VKSLFGAKRVILRGLQTPHGTAMGSNHGATRSQCVEVIADRDGRNSEPPNHIRHSYLAILVDEV
jgi:hypothetical protein